MALTKRLRGLGPSLLLLLLMESRQLRCIPPLGSEPRKEGIPLTYAPKLVFTLKYTCMNRDEPQSNIPPGMPSKNPVSAIAKSVMVDPLCELSKMFITCTLLGAVCAACKFIAGFTFEYWLPRPSPTDNGVILTRGADDWRRCCSCVC